MGTDHPRLQADLGATVLHRHAGPAVAQRQQHGVGDGLTGKAGPGRPECHRGMELPAQAQHALHLRLGLRLDDDPRHQAIHAGVGAVGQQPQGIGDDPFGRDHALEGLTELPIDVSRW